MSNNKLVIFLFIFLIIKVNCNDDDLLQKWNILAHKTQLWNQKFINYYRGDFERLLDESQVNVTCKKSILFTINEYANFTDWAFEMFNSWAKIPPSGLLQGTLTDLGSYDDCVSIKPTYPTDVHIGVGQYCLIDLNPPSIPKHKPFHNLFHQLFNQTQSNQLNGVFKKLSRKAQYFHYFSLRVGICLPSACDKEDVKRIVNAVTNEASFHLKGIHCETKQTTSFTSIQLVAICVLFFFILMAIIATLIDATEANVMHADLLSTFSLQRNWSQFMSTSVSTHEITCLHGMRFFTLSWIMLGHTLLFTNFQIYNKIFKFEEMITDIMTQPFMNSSYSVDTFYFISGFLLIYSMRPERENINGFNMMGLIMKRYLRLTPQIAIAILFTFLLPLLNSGPLWHETLQPIVNNCHKNWWTNLIYLQNYINTENICLLHTWWLANDIHFHIIALFLIIIIYKIQPWIGITLTYVMIILPTCMTAIFVYLNHIPPAIINTQLQSGETWKVFVIDFFWKPYCHASPFFIGLINGYLLISNKIPRISKLTNSLISKLVLLGFIGLTFDSYYWLHGNAYSPLTSAIIFPLNRLIWSCLIAWTITSSTKGNGSIITDIFSHKVFIPLSKATYSIYLTHMWVVWYGLGSLRERLDASNLTETNLFLSQYLTSIFIGIIFTLIFEMPILSVLRQFRLIGYKSVLDKNIDKNGQIVLVTKTYQS